MHSTLANPYRSPAAIESEGDVVELPHVRHRLSNRLMAIVIGFPGLLFVAASLLFLAHLLDPASSKGLVLDRLFGSGISAFGIFVGSSMLAAARYLWRYDSIHVGVAPSEGLAPRFYRRFSTNRASVKSLSNSRGSSMS